jgi:hypothetical protein
MNWRHPTVLLLLLALSAGAAAGTSARVAPDCASAALAPPAMRTLAQMPWLSEREPGERLTSICRPAAAPHATGGDATLTAHVPAPPSGFALGLGALISLGAYQAGRSLRKLHIGVVPDWYHAGGPAQVGHATPFDLDSAGVLPQCAFVRPAPPRPALRGTWEAEWAYRTQCVPRAAAPRAPPFSFREPAAVS